MSPGKAALLAEIGEYRHLPAGWDGELDEKTDPLCLDTAEEFVRLLPDDVPMPEFSAATGKEVALYWEKSGIYLIVHCFPENGIRIFGEKEEKRISIETGVGEDAFALVAGFFL